MTRTVLVTRAEPGLAGTLARLDAKGYAAIAAPTAQIEDLPVEAPSDIAALAVTSRNGAKRAADIVKDRSLPLYAVGKASADAARAFGFTKVKSANGDGPALAALIASERPSGRVAHIRGRDQAFDLAADLNARGLNTVSLVAYAAQPVSHLSEAAAAALLGQTSILLHSAKGAERFLDLVEVAGLSNRLAEQRVVAISAQAAAPCLAVDIGRIDIAASPNEDSLFQALEAAVD